MDIQANLNPLKTVGEQAKLMAAFAAFNTAAMTDGAVPVLNKELIAIAVVHTTQCPYCIEIQVGKARDASTNDVEVTDTIMIAAALRAGAAEIHGMLCFEKN